MRFSCAEAVVFKLDSLRGGRDLFQRNLIYLGLFHDPH